MSMERDTQESQCYSSGLKAGRLETQEKPMFQFKSEGQKRLISQHKQVMKEFPLTQPFSGLQLIGWDPPNLGRINVITQSTHTNVNLIQTHPRRQNNVWLNVLAPCGPIKMSHKINHHGPSQHHSFNRWMQFTISYL